MVRETRHLWVGNLPETIREDRIRDHFKRYGRVQSVKLLGRSGGGVGGGGGGAKDEEGGGACATVSFMDIKSAAKAHHSEQKLDERTLTTEYHEPAAIPCPGTLYSGSGPPNPPGASAGSRFSSHGGSEDLSGSFERSSHFYERGERSETSGSGYIRRGGSSSSGGTYHSAESLSRSRARDRLYRNGPYATPLIERDSKQRIVGEPRKSSSENDDLVRHNRVVSRSSSSGHHRVSASGWGYDSPSPRYSASGVPSTPEHPYSDDRRETTPIVHKKHSKSGFSTQNNSYPTLLISISRRSGSDSASNSESSGSRSRSSSASSQSGSSTCSSASSSPASEKSCSTHSQQSSLRSGAQSGVSTSHTNSVSPAVHAEDRRPLAICVRNLPARSSDTSLKDGLYHEYKKHGKVTWVKVVGQGVDRYALVCFKKADDVEKALQVSHDKLFFGCKIEVAPYQGYDVDDNEFRPFEAEQDEFHPKATRTLFIGNLEKDITTQEIRKHFDQFGEIIEIDIKKQGNSASYAFCQFSDITSVVRAMRTLDGEHIGANRIKLGFGKSMHTNCVWVDGVSETVSEKYLSTHFGQFGPVTHVVIDRSRGHALVFYEQITYAQQAVKDMRGNSLRGRKLQVDYASRECQEAFYDRIEKQSSTSHSNFDNNIQASPQSTSTIVRVYDSGSTATSPVVNSTPTRYPTLTTGGSGVVVTTRFNTAIASSRTTYNRPTASSPTTPSPSPRSSRHGHSSSSSSSQRFDYNLEYNPERRSYRSYEENPSCEDGGTLTTPVAGSGEIRHLQKERVALIEQLEDYTSSGDDTAAGRRRCSKHRRSQSGGEGSRPGTPLCDERPDPPVEPRRAPRERPPDPLSLPLPRFAAQVLSPRPVLPSPPASPQTPHSSSSDSEPSPPSPEWEERLRSLDEKYEKWSGSRSGVTKVDPTTMKIKHKLLELDLHELQPSEIVKSVLAKRSVFDEDSKRLENFGEKYEPREFIPASRTNVLRRLDMSPLSSPVNKSPGLQYPFPSHPPSQPLSSSGLASTSTIPTLTVASEAKPANTFLTNCTRQFTPKISSPSSSVETSPRPSTQLPPDKFKAKCTPTPAPLPAVRKDIVTTPPPKPKPCSIRRDSSEEKSELRRKSRDEVCTESVAKKDDISESDKVKDAQISERRKSTADKRRGSVDIKDFSNSKPLDNSCDRPKESSDKQEEKRRGSSEAEATPMVINDPRLKPDLKKNQEPNETNQSYDNTRVIESEKKKIPSDCIERRKDIDSLHRHNSTEHQDKKKDVLGVNSEKDRRRGRESVDCPGDNPKHNKKVPESKKETEPAPEKREKEVDVVRHSEVPEKKKESPEQHGSSKSREKRESIDREKRRDSREEQAEKSKSEKIVSDNLDRFKDHKNNESIDSSKKKEHHDFDKLTKKDCDESMRNSKKEVEHDIDGKKEGKHKEERRKNSETEISKEHSLFKKVFGFADSIRHHKGGVDRRDNDTSTAVKTDTPEPNKHREKKEKKEKEEHAESKHKSCNRKSPDNPENNRHKEEKRRHSDSKRRDFDTPDDLKQKEENHVPQESKPHNKSDRKKEDPSYKDSNHRNAYYEHNSSEHSKYNRDSERRKEFIPEEVKKPENDVNCLENSKKEEHEDEFYERRKDDGFRNKEIDRRKGSFDSTYENTCESNSFQKSDKKNDVLESSKYNKHDRHREKSKDHDTVQNCRTKEDRKNETHDKHKSEKRKDGDGHRIKEDKKINDDNLFDSVKQKENDKKKEDSYDGVKIKKDGYSTYRESIRETTDVQDRLKEITDRKKEEKDRRKDREFSIKDAVEDRRKDKDNDKVKSKHSRDYEHVETKMNGDHDCDYSLDTAECRKAVISSYEDNEHRDAVKKEKKRDKTTWPATIGCKRRLSSQDSFDINDESKRIKPERRDSKDSGRSSGSSRKGSGEKHKGYKLLEEKIKEDKERERKNLEETNLEPTVPFEEKTPKPASRKEKRNSGEKRKEERKFKIRPRENGTASESDLASGDDDQLSKASKRQQHSIFDIVDDEPAYISMYDKVKARSTKNMQKLEEEKKQEKLKEKFHALKQSRAKREEKKRSTSYDEDSDSEKGSMRRNSKLLLTSSEDDAGSEPDIRVRKNKMGILYDTSEDDTVITTGKVRKNSFHEETKSARKIISDISEDDTATIKHSTPKVKVNRSITFDAEPKSRKIMSDTSEDDSARINPTPRIMKPIRIHSDDSEGDLGFEDSIRNETKPLQNISDMFQSRPVEVNHFTNSIHEEPVQQPLQSSPESFRRNSLDSTTSEQHRKKSHKKKQKRQKNLEENEDGTIKKHSSKKEKKRAHRDKDDEEKRKKRAERESINKRDDKLEDIFGPLSDDSVKAISNKWNVAQVYGSDSESERENIRKKEKKRREKKMRELDEAGRAIEAKLMDSCDNINLDEPIKAKKKKRKKSRDEKSKHHQPRGEEEAAFSILPKEETKVEIEDEKPIPVIEIKEEVNDEAEDVDAKEGYEADIKKETKMECEDEMDNPPDLRQQSMSSLLDSPPPSQPSSLTCKKPGIPGFSSEIDDNIHETAVKSISESTCTTLDESDLKYDDKCKSEETPVTGEDGKPTTIISQEETEDAVAALLMEDTFGGGFEGYNEDTPKPDTPVSEPDLQIDTDTEDTYDPIDFSRPPRTPDIPSNFYRQNDTREGLEERIMMSLACSSDSSLKESPRPLQMPPTPDHKSDKKDTSDSDSFDPDKPLHQEKQTVVKNLMEVDEEEPIREPTPEKEVTCQNSSKVIKETTPNSTSSENDLPTIPCKEVKGSSETKVVETPMAINRSPTPPKLPVPVEKIVPPLDMPKLIVIPQKVSAITVNVSQPDVPSLAPLSNRSDSSQNFSKVDRMHPLPTQTVVKPQNAQISQPCLPITSAAAVISSVEATIVQSTIKAHVVNLLGPVSKPSSAQSTNHSESAQSRLQGWAAKVVPSCDLVSKPMPTITTVMTSQSKSQPPPLIPPSISQSTAIPSLSQSETISSLSPQGQKVLPLQTLQLTCQTSQPLLSQQPQSISQSSTLSQPPPLIQTSMSRPPPLVHTSHAPIQVVSVTPLLSPRLDVHVTATQSSPANIPATSVHTSNQPANFTDKVGHRLSINTLPPLKPVVNTHILQSSLPSQNKCNTTVTLSTPNQTTAATVRTIHPLASLTLVPTVKDVKSAASPSPPASALQAKQLHVITSATQLSPTPPISPQNLKLVRPSIPVTTHVQVPPLQNINIQPLKSPVVSQHSPNRTNTPIVPLLQTVNIDDHIKSSAQFSGKNLIPVPPNPQLLLTPIQAPHPEKVITLTPSQPLPLQPKQHSPVPLALKSSGPANIIKSSESTVKDSTPDAPVVDKNDKPSLIISEKCEAPSSLSSDLGKTMTVSSPSIMPVVSPVDKLTPPKDGPETYSVVRKNIEENVVTPKPIIIEPKNGKPPQDDSKPLNAVIQDLTMRAANKQQQQQQQLQQPLPWKSRPNQVEVLKSESSKPIEQVVRELAMRKRQASESKELEKLAPPVDEPKPVIEPSKLEEKSQTLSSNEPSPSVEPTVPKTELGDEELPKAEVIPEDPVKKVSPIVPIVDEKLKDAVKNETTDPNVLLEEPMLISEDKKFEKEKTPDPEKKPLPPSPEEQTTAPEAKPKEEPEEIAPKSSTIKEIPLSEKEVSLKPEAIIPTPTPPTRGGRGGRKRKGAGGRGGISTRRTRANNTPNTTPSTDIYEFRDDSEEETGRPRLILTIKSPPEPLATPKVLIPPPQPTQQPLSPPPPALAPTPAASGATTRKSRRLQEKDGTKPSNDDIIEDMITSRGRPSRRATRSTVHNLAPPVETTRKSPRRKQHQSSSAASTPGNGSLQVPGRNTRQRSASPLPGPTTVAQAAPTPTTPMTATSTPVTPMPAVTPVAPTLTPATPVAVTPVAATPMPTTPITATQTPTPPIAATPLLPTPKAATPTLPTPKVATPPTLPTPKVAAPPTLPTPKVATPTAATPTAIIPTLPAPVAATLTPTTPTAMAPTPALQRNKSPTPQRQPSPAKAPVQASVPSPVVASPAPATPQPPPSPPQQSPQASTPIPQPMPVPTTQPQPPPPPDAASPAPVVTVSPSVVSQPTPLPTSIITPSPLPTIVPVTSAIITSTHNSSPIHNHITTSPAPAHASSIPVTSNPLTTPVQLTTTHASPMQPAPGQPPPAHSGPAHPLPVSTVHPVPGHHPPSAHIGTHASAIKFRKTASGEPTKLIDPVTGLLIPMTESEEGQYIPVGVATHLNKEPSEGEPPEKRARLLNLAGKDEAVARTPLPRPSVVRPTASQPSPSPPIATPPAAHSCSVKIMVPTSHPIEAHLGRGPQIPPPLLGGVPTKVPMSGVVPMTPKSHILQAVTPSRMRPQAPPPPQHSKGPMAPKAHILQSMGNAQAREGVVGSPAPHQGALMTGSVASPPLRAHQQPIVTGASSGRVLVKSGSDSQGSRVGEGKHIPSSQSLPQRGQVVQPGSSLSSYEAPMHSVVAELLPNPPWSQRHSPPPAHQNSSTPQQQGEVVQHVSTYPPHHHYVHPPFVFQSPYLRDAAGMPGPYHRSTATKGTKRQHVKGSSDMEDRPSAPSAAAASASSMVASPPLELRRRSPHDRTTDSPQVVPVYMHRGGQQFYYEGLPHPPPPAHRPHNPPNTGRLQTPPHASQVPPQADSLLMLLQRYPVMWQGLLALKNDQAAVQMHFVFGNPVVARESLPCNSDGSTPPLRIAQRMRLEQTQVEGVARKMQMDNEHCMLLALPCGRDPMDVLQQSNNLLNGFITYLQQKQAAGIVNIAAPGSPQPAYVVHIFPSCDFANESLARIAPDLLHRVADLAHLLIVIATV